MPPKLLYLVTEDWYFWSHRLPMAQAAQAAGFEVTVAGRMGQHRERIEAAGFRVHALDWRRRGNGPLATLRAITEIVRLYRRERPDIVHHVAIKPTVLGGLAAWLAGVPAVVNALTGLGFVFIGEGRGLGGLIKPPVRALIRFVLGRRGSHLIVQNSDDHRLLVDHGFVDPTRVTVIRGSGIDTDHYTPLPEPDGPVTVAYVGRMLGDKGVPTLVDAYRRLQARGVAMRLLLVGTPDPENPTTVLEATLRAWATLPGLEWRGAVTDVRTIWAEAHIAVLPSRREGLPKSLLEAAACARALVATDVPGCREIARAGENALLVPPDDPEALARALEILVLDSDLRRRYAAASRRLVLSDLATGPVGARTVALYRHMLTSKGFGTSLLEVALRAQPPSLNHLKGTQAMQKVTIDGREYDYETLSEDVKQQLGNLAACDQEINHLNIQLAIVQTARVAYARALNEALSKQAPAFQSESLI